MMQGDPFSEKQPLNVIVLEAGLESQLGSALVQTPLGVELKLAPQLQQLFLDQLEQAVQYCWQEGYHRTALLVDGRIRRHLHRLIEKRFPRVPVISYTEVGPDFQLNVLQTIAI
ncbi:MAG: FHIPEP family type III secretion protein [Candidatus Sericytochromatia bacterium]